MTNHNKSGSVNNFALKFRGRLASFLNYHHHIARSVLIIAGLLVFLAIVPPFIRTALTRGLLEHPYLTGMLFFFSLLALSLLWNTGQQIDAWVFLYFNLRGERPLWLDKIMLGFTQLGNGLAGLTIALSLFLLGNHRLAYELILGTLTLWLVVEPVKALIHRSRPFIKLTQTRIVGSLARGRSFPSGHTSQSFFMATLLFHHFNGTLWLAVLLYILAILVAVTRIYVGAHYPRDVLAGAILGSIWGFLGSVVDAHFLVVNSFLSN
jgi:membrane-associated phospholipid phosphatase